MDTLGTRNKYFTGTWSRGLVPRLVSVAFPLFCLLLFSVGDAHLMGREFRSPGRHFGMCLCYAREMHLCFHSFLISASLASLLLFGSRF